MRPLPYLKRLLHTLALLGSLLLTLLPTPGSTHEMPKSSVMLHFRQTHLLLDLRLPLDRLELASGLKLAQPLAQPVPQPVTQSAPQPVMPPTKAPNPALAVWQSALPTYLLARVHAYSETGQAWAVQLQALHPPSAEKPDEIQVQLTLTPPANGTLTRFRLEYDIILREIATHIAVVSVQSDWERGVLANKPELLATLRFDEHAIDIRRSQSAAWAGLTGMFQLGVEHIAAGVDHVLFLLTLLLTAPVLAKAGRWQRQSGWRSALWQVLASVSAFTLGHSLALALGAYGLLRLPSQPVEVLIAGSVLVSALHAARPLYAGREALVAGSFGLVHGLAFAASLSAFELDPAHLASAIFGFNLGIEAVQLVIVLVTVPSLMLLGATPWFGHFRLSVAALAGTAALGWILERSTDWRSPLTVLAEQLPDHTLAVGFMTCAVGLLALALGARVRASYKNRHPAACISNERC